MSHNKFTVTGIMTTLSGTYAGYIDNGRQTWTGNFNFKVGDVVEWWNYDGYVPSKIIVNGVVTWTEKDQLDYWEHRDERMEAKIIEKLKAKGLYHKTLNP